MAIDWVQAFVVLLNQLVYLVFVRIRIWIIGLKAKDQKPKTILNSYRAVPHREGSSTFQLQLEPGGLSCRYEEE